MFNPNYEVKMTEKWIGDKNNGIRLNIDDDEVLDEAALYIDGECVMHLEATSDVGYFLGLYGRDDSLIINIFSNNLKSHISAKSEI
jgi:hypothetical protein